jgi:hypothetical protein
VGAACGVVLRRRSGLASWLSGAPGGKENKSGVLVAWCWSITDPTSTTVVSGSVHLGALLSNQAISQYLYAAHLWHTRPPPAARRRPMRLQMTRSSARGLVAVAERMQGPRQRLAEATAARAGSGRSGYAPSIGSVPRRIVMHRGSCDPNFGTSASTTLR